MQEYNFRYYTAKNSVTLDEFGISAKSGPFLKYNFTVADFQHFYHFSTKDYHVLYMTYIAPGGKTKKAQLYTQTFDGDFKALVEMLQQKYPAKSLNHLDEKEAFKSMKMTNPAKWAPIVVFFLLAITMSIFFYPMLVHYFDKGHAEVTIEDFLVNPDVGTRNITIEGWPLDAGIEQTTTSSKSSSEMKSNFIPLVDTTWQEGKPIKVVLEFGEMTQSEYEAALNEIQFTGVIRNVWWEGLGGDNVDFFKEHYSLTFDGEPLLIEVTNTTKNDGFVIWVWGGTMVFILIIVVIVAIRMRRR